MCTRTRTCTPGHTHAHMSTDGMPASNIRAFQMHTNLSLSLFSLFSISRMASHVRANSVLGLLAGLIKKEKLQIRILKNIYFIYICKIEEESAQVCFKQRYVQWTTYQQ